MLGAFRVRKNIQPNLNMTTTNDIAEENRCRDTKETAIGRVIEQEMAKIMTKYELGKNTNKPARMASGEQRECDNAKDCGKRGRMG